MPLEVAAGPVEPPDLVEFKKQVRKVHDKVKAKYGLCEVSNRALSSVMGPQDKPVPVVIEALVPQRIMVNLDAAELSAYAGKTPEEQTAIAAAYLAKVKYGAVNLVLDINLFEKQPSDQRQNIDGFTPPAGHIVAFTSRDGRVGHLYRAERDGERPRSRQYAVCGGGDYYTRPVLVSRRSENRMCPKCLRRLGLTS